MRTGNPVADALREAAARHALPAAAAARHDRCACQRSAGRAVRRPRRRSTPISPPAKGPVCAGGRIAWRRCWRPSLMPPARRQDAPMAWCACCSRCRRRCRQGRLPLPRGRLERAGIARACGRGGPGQGRRLDAGPARRGSCAISRQRGNTWQILPRPMRVAFLPLALVRPYLRALERPGRNLAAGGRRDRAAATHLGDRPRALAGPHVSVAGKSYGGTTGLTQVSGGRA